MRQISLRYCSVGSRYVDGIPKPVVGWLYAVKTFSLEIALQFLPDGVNFEKSIPYHRLVTELFLIGLIAMERAGLPVEPTALKRIHAACVYTAAYTTPDGLSPNVGDNDARVLGYDPVPPRDHRPLLGVAAGVLHDADLKTAAYRMPASLVWLLGSLGGTTWHKLGPTTPAWYSLCSALVALSHRTGRRAFFMGRCRRWLAWRAEAVTGITTS
jgi:hypothetical protein